MGREVVGAAEKQTNKQTHKKDEESFEANSERQRKEVKAGEGKADYLPTRSPNPTPPLPDSS